MIGPGRLRLIHGMWDSVVDHWRDAAGDDLVEVLSILKDMSDIEDEARGAAIWLLGGFVRARKRTPATLTFLAASAAARMARNITIRKLRRSTRVR